jgi:hypothetical protein
MAAGGNALEAVVADHQWCGVAGRMAPAWNVDRERFSTRTRLTGTVAEAYQRSPLRPSWTAAIELPETKLASTTP